MSRFRTTLTAAVILSIGLSIGGCAPSPPGLSEELAESWQAQVAAVADGAAAGDAAGALTLLDGLQADAQRASQAGEITVERAAAIQQAIDLVRADLRDLSAGADVPEPSSTTGSSVPASTPAEEADRASDGNGDGKGTGKGNRKGKAKGKGKGAG